jgi:hypothetical protein
MRLAEEIEARGAVARRLRRQAEECARLGSPLYADLLARTATDVESGGEDTWAVLSGHRSDPPLSALALRLMGAVNRLRLRAEEPQAFASWDAFEEVLGRRYRALRELIELPVQTNEVGRSAALAIGFAAVAEATAKPQRLLELGASAGLNLNWDRYGYSSAAIEVASREGCDAAPVDPGAPEGRETLFAYVWPDQEARLARLAAALEVAAAHPVTVDQASAPDWAAAKLAEPAPGLATVVFHSLFIQYLRPEDRARLEATIAAAGDRATAAAPLAWLRMEGAGEMAELRLTLWPGGEERLLARAGYHGDPVEVLESGAG